MSYCRWSDCGFQSDVYAYESDAGYMVSIAKSRYDRVIPEHDFSSAEAMNASNAARDATLRVAKLVPIGLPHDGTTFVHHDRAGLLARLRHLREIGYRVPQHAIDAVAEEINWEGAE